LRVVLRHASTVGLHESWRKTQQLHMVVASDAIS
jgi:hypothetical protein